MVSREGWWYERLGWAFFLTKKKKKFLARVSLIQSSTMFYLPDKYATTPSIFPFILERAFRCLCWLYLFLNSAIYCRNSRCSVIFHPRVNTFAEAAFPYCPRSCGSRILFDTRWLWLGLIGRVFPGNGQAAIIASAVGERVMASDVIFL